MTNPYLRALRGEDEEITAPAGIRSPYLQKLENDRRVEDQQRARALNNAFQVNPDEEAELRQLYERGRKSADSAIGGAPLMPVPPGADMVKNKEQFKTDLSMRELMNNIISSPALKRKYTQEDFARIASDDSDQLSLVERTLKGIGGRGLMTEFPRATMADLAFRKVMGETLSFEDEGRLFDATVRVNELTAEQEGRGIISYALNIVGSTAGQLITGAPMGAAGAAAGAGVGAGAGAAGAAIGGQLGPQIAAPEEIVTVPAAAITGALVGGRRGYVAGTAVHNFRQITGLSYLEYSAYRDINGQLMDPDTARGAALIVGALSTGTETLADVTLAKALPGFEKFLGKGGKEVAEQLLATDAGRSALSKLGRRVGETSGIEAVTEGVQAVIEILGGEAAKGIAEGEFTPITLGEAAARVGESSLQGAIGGGGVPIVTAPVTIPVEQYFINREAARSALEERSAEGQLNRLQGAVDAASQSKLLNRDRAALEEFVNEAAEGTELSNVFIAPDSFAQVAEELGVDVMELARQLGVEDQVQDSALTSTPITLPVGKFIATVADTDLAQPMMEVAKMNPFLPSRAEINAAREAGDEQFVARAETLAAAVEQDDTVRAEAQAISERVAGELTAAGRFTGDANRVYATAATQMYVQLAERLGITPQQAFDQYPLSVAGQRVGGQPEGQVLASGRQETVSEAQQRASGRLAFFEDKPEVLEAARAHSEKIGGNIEEDLSNPGFLERQYLEGLNQKKNELNKKAQDAAQAGDNAAYETFADQVDQVQQQIKEEETRQKQVVKRTQDDETLGQTRRLRDRAETLKKYGLDPEKKHTTRQVAAALEARTRQKHGTIARGDYSAEAAKKIRDWVVDEVMFEVDQAKENPEKSAVGWYSEKFQLALDRMGLAFNELVDGIEGSNLPGVQQLQSKEGARQFLTALIAVTSDGAKVKDNLRFALATYAYFRENGALPTSVGFGGERNSSMNLNLANIQALLDQYGAEGMGEYLLQKDTVSNLKKVAQANGETFNTAYKSDMQLPLAALYFGPKLGAFYANLRGDTGYLTMDRWWSRTFNRYRGTLLAKPTREGLDRFKALVTEDRQLNQPASEMTDDEALALTAEYVKTYKDKKYKNGTEIEKAANTLWKAAFEKLEDQPFNASDREFMVNTTLAAQKLLKRRGVNLTVADIQAVLWYYEKRLYGTLGARQTADISYGDVAVEYAEGFKSGEISYQDVLGERSDDAVSREPGKESYLNQADDENLSADEIVDASEDQTIGPEETFGQDEIDGRRPEQAGDGRGRDTRGSLAPLEGAPRNLQGPIAELVSAAEQYASANGIPLKRQAGYVELDPERGARIAQAYEDMPHAPNDPAVQEAYADLIRQTRAQYDALIGAGYVFTFFDGASDPYAGNPSAAMRDLRNNKRMAVYGTYDGYGTEGVTAGALADNPMLADTGLQWPDQNGVMQPVVANDLFRAVHDAFGHGIEGAGFRARGEENAWQAHVRLFTGPAVGAITSETRGQNSWLNFGPYGETNRTADLEGTIFAEQKTGLMPEWTWTEGRAGDMEATFEQEEIDGQATARPAGRDVQVDRGRLSGPRRLPDGTTEAVHYGRVAGLTATDPNEWGRGGAFLSRDERNRIGEAPPRTYFGLNVDLPGGYVKEAGTGDNTYYAYIPMDRMYDLAEDPDNLVERAKEIVQERKVAPRSALELAVQEAEYAGFWVDHPAYGMAGVVFEPVPVSTERRPDAVPDETFGQGGGLVSAAIRIGGKTYTGRNHDEAAQAAREDGQVVDDIGEISGFISASGKFLRRDDPEAVYSAISAGQLDPALQRVVEMVLRRGDAVTLTSDMLTFAEGQAEPGYQARGRRGEYSPRLKEIRLNASADFSTFLHELGHHFLEVYDSTALNLRDKEAAGETLTEGEQGVIDDTRRLLTELARQTNIEVEGDVLDWWRGRAFEERVPMHEQFARLTEAYFMDGKAPTPEMQGMFQTFRRWMLQVYSSLTELNVELNDEVRGILDRMVAAEDDIKTAEQNRGLNAMFATKPEFMTDDEWRGYQQLALAATQAAEEELTARSLRDMKWLSRAKAREIRKLQKQAAEQRAIVEAAVTAEVMSQPINRARTFLKRGLNPDGTEVQGPHKLSIEMLKAAYPDGSGVDWTALGYGRYGMLGKEGLDADTLAELFRFESGDALIQALLETEPVEQTIQDETDARMLEEFGDLVDEAAVNRAADEALHNAMRGRVLAAEYAALAKASGQRKMLAAAAQQIAKQVIGKQNAAKLKPQKYVAAERSAARKAEQALRRNDLVGAATAKRDQLLNFELAREAQRVLKQRDRTLDLFRKVTAAKRDTVSKTRNYDLVQVARAILAAHGMGQVRNAPIEYLDLLKQYDPHLYTALETTLLVAAAQNKTLTDMSVDEFLGLGDLVKQLWDLSREEKRIEIDGRKIELEQVTTELTERLATLGDTERAQIAEAATDAQKTLRSFVGLMASIRRVEFWARSMDGGEVGPFTKYLWRPISEAADRYRADRNRLLMQFRELFAAIEPTMGGKKIAARELSYTFKNKAELLHAILHTGNTSNKRKLLLGRQWGAERPDGTLDESRWQAFISRMAQDGTLTEADFDFVQNVWDLLEETKPLAQAAHRKVFGRYFAEITAEPVDTPFGTYKGGYVPAIYDQFFVADAAVRAQQEQVEANDSTMFPSPASGFAKGRVEYNEVLELNLQLLPMHIDRVLKFAHLASPVRDVLRVLRDKEFARGMEQVDPTAQTDMLLPWLQTASRQIVEEPGKGQGGKLAATFFRGVRNRSGMGLMFGNLVNTAQQFTGFPLVLLRVKPQYVGAALARYVANPAQMTKAARGASLMMVERGDNQMSAMYNEIERIIDKKNLYGRTADWLGRHTYFMQQAVQNVMDVIVWAAAYDQALARGETEKEAAKQGDAVVRQTQGSVFAEDIARIEKGPAWARTFTHMYSYFSMWVNLLGGDVEIIRREIGLRKGAGKLFYVYLIGFLAPAITAQLVADAMRGQLPEDEDDDGYLDEWLSWFFMTQAKTALAFVPIAGQAGNATIGAFTDVPYDDRVAGSPAISAIESAARTVSGKSVYQAMFEDGDKSRAVKDTLNLMTLLTGLPFQAAARPIGYAVDVAEEDIEPTDDLDYLRGLATGSASQASR